jgi:hypothetical protein
VTESDTIVAPEENDTSPADTEPEDTAEDGVPEETFELTPEPTPEPTPTPTPTPPPTPTPKTIPEQYVIPDVDPNDLTAVHAYIQEQLNIMAASPTFPNYVEITANDDCTVFTVVCNSLDESVAERASAEQMFEFGRMYAAYAGTTVDNIHIDYNNGIGNLLYARDSNKS